MSTPNQNDYLASIDWAAQRIARKSTKTQERLIMRAYKQSFDDAFTDYLKQLEKGKTPSQQYFMKCKLAYIQQLYTTMQSQSMICDEKIPKRILDQYAQVMKDITKNKDIIAQINKNVDVTSRNIIEQMTKGEIYKNGIGLDSRLWSSTNAAGRKIEDAITSCLARGISSAEASKIISQFAKSGHHTWDTKKIREKLGNGYASKYGTGGLDYEALRLMRTTNTHMAQLTVMNSDKVNPYNQFVKYHTGHAGSRTCSMCRDRDGKIYPIHDAPLDHPNGLCWLSPVMSKDGKTEMSLADMIDDVNDYYDGKPNSGVMKQWLHDNHIPIKPTQKPKPTKKSESSKPTKPTKSVNPEIPKGHLYTDQERAERITSMEKGLIDAMKNCPGNTRGAQTHAKEITKRLQNMPLPVQDLYLATFKYFKLQHTSSVPCYKPSNGKLYMSMSKMANAQTGPYSTFFHEYGHMIDAQLGTFTKNKKIFEYCKDDIEAQLERKTEKRLSDELRSYKDTIAPVSDIYGGVTKGKVQGYWGHAQSYWDRKNRAAEVSSEAWADILECMANKENSKHVNKYLPQTKSYILETVKEFNENIKNGKMKFKGGK